MYHAIRDSGGTVVRYTEYRGIGHNIWEYTPLENTLNDWLFAQQLGAEHESPEEPVSNFSVIINENNKPELTWTAPDDGIEEDEYIWAYQIYRDAELLETVDRDSVRFIDLDAEPGITYSYSISPMNYFFLEAPVTEEISVISGIEDEYGTIPNKFVLNQNYPNPFNPETTISYSISEPATISLKVYDMLGKEVKTLVNEHQPTGSYKIEFDASALSSGVYFYQLHGRDFGETRKMLLIK
jgi:hypothetical protein